MACFFDDLVIVIQVDYVHLVRCGSPSSQRTRAKAIKRDISTLYHHPSLVAKARPAFSHL